LRRKIARQEAWSTSQPPTNGPASVPSDASPAQTPMPGARSSVRSVPLSRARLLGTTRAAPAPWTTRAAMRISKDGATAHTTDATSMTRSPATSTGRRPYRSASAPATSRRAVAVRRYPVRLHWMDTRLAPSSRLIAGTATFTTLASRKPAIEARAAAATTAMPALLRSATGDP
jgi:hypothetical protein